MSLVGSLPLHNSADTPMPRPRGKDRTKLAPAKIDSRFNVAVSHTDVKLDLAVSNIGGRHAEIEFPNGQAYDFVVVDSVGREVWRWSNKRMFTQGVRNKQLGTGESTTYTETWRQPKPGKYTAIAQLKSSNYPVDEKVDFVIQ